MDVLDVLFRNIFGLGANKIFSSNMASFLAGMEDLCNESYYDGMPLYTYFGLCMLGSTVVFLIMKYIFPFDRVMFSSRGCWWIFAGVAFVINFIFVAYVLWQELSTAVLKFNCDEEFVNIISNMREIGMFAGANAFISFVLFGFLSWIPYLRWLLRRLKLCRNCFEQKPF